jgi:hypothetical protein
VVLHVQNKYIVSVVSISIQPEFLVILLLVVGVAGAVGAGRAVFSKSKICESQKQNQKGGT